MSQIEQLEKDNNELRKQLRYYEDLLDQVSAPIIPSIIPNCVLVPLTGILSIQRFEMVRTKMLTNLADQDVDTVLMDFTAITDGEKSNLSLHELAGQIEMLIASLQLMGIQTLCVGFSPQLIQEMVNANVQLSNIQAFSTFRTGLAHLMEQKGITFAKIESDA